MRAPRILHPRCVSCVTFIWALGRIIRDSGSGPGLRTERAQVSLLVPCHHRHGGATPAVGSWRRTAHLGSLAPGGLPSPPSPAAGKRPPPAQRKRSEISLTASPSYPLCSPQTSVFSAVTLHWPTGGKGLSYPSFCFLAFLW